MKTYLNPSAIIRRARHASGIGVAAAIMLAGCAHAPLRQSTAMSDDVTHIGELPLDVALPVAVRKVAPKYPERLICAGIEGSVWIQCWVDRNGEAQDIAAFNASEPEFGEAAVAAVKQWSFTPGNRDGRAFGTWIAIPFHFMPKYPSESALRRP